MKPERSKKPEKETELEPLSIRPYARLLTMLRLPVVVTVECQFLEGPDGLLGTGPGRIS